MKLLQAVCLTLAVALSAGAQDLAKIGPQVGERVPAFTGTDQFGRAHTLQSIMGPEGAMLVFFRSADW